MQVSYILICDQLSLSKFVKYCVFFELFTLLTNFTSLEILVEKKSWSWASLPYGSHLPKSLLLDCYRLFRIFLKFHNICIHFCIEIVLKFKTCKIVFFWQCKVKKMDQVNFRLRFLAGKIFCKVLSALKIFSEQNNIVKKNF